MAAGRNEHTHPTLWKICFLVGGEDYIQDDEYTPSSLPKAIDKCKQLNASYAEVFHFPVRIQ